MTTLNTRISARLRDALDKAGYDTQSPSCKVELRLRLGETTAAKVWTYLRTNGVSDISLSQLDALCQMLDLPMEQLVGSENENHLVVWNYLGGSPCHIYVPPGLVWDKSILSDPLFYAVAPDDLCEGVAAGMFLVFSRITLGSEPGDIVMIETESRVMLRICDGVQDGMQQFVTKAGTSDGLVTIPEGQEVSTDFNQEVPVLTGRLVWKIDTMP